MIDAKQNAAESAGQLAIADDEPRDEGPSTLDSGVPDASSSPPLPAADGGGTQLARDASSDSPHVEMPAACETGQVKCVDDTLWRCNRSRTDWENPQRCGLGLCDQANKRCRACTPGTKRCQAETVLTCAEQGEGFLSSACDASAPHCMGAGQCVQCRVDADCRPTPCHVANCSTSSACALVPTPSEPKTTSIPDGTLVLKAMGEPVWVVFGGARFWVKDADTLMRLYGGFGNVTMQSAAVVDELPFVPVTGTTLVEENGDRVWRIEHGKARHITSPEVLAQYCGGWAVVRTIPAGALADNNIPVGDPIAE